MQLLSFAVWTQQVLANHIVETLYLFCFKNIAWLIHLCSLHIQMMLVLWPVVLYLRLYARDNKKILVNSRSGSKMGKDILA